MNGEGLGRSLARLNHIFIPATKSGRDRARRMAPVRAARPLVWLYTALTDAGRGFAVLLILIGAASIDMASSQGYWLWALGVGVLLAGIARRSQYDLDTVEFTITAPRQVELGEPLQFQLELHNRGQRDIGVINIDRPLLTWDGSWEQGPPSLAALPAGARRSLSTRARFVQRGHHHLDNFWAGALLPGGMVQGPRLAGGGVHLVVVPRIAPVDSLALPSGSRYQQGGVALASHTGESMELMGVRPYRQGDPVRDLHARSWARRGQPVVREYHQEYFSRVGVVLDTDPGSGGSAVLEAGISLAAGVIAHLTRGESLIDVLVTGDRLHGLTLGRSLGHLEQALDHLACVRPGPPLEMDQTLGLLGPYLDRLSCVLLILLRQDAVRIGLASEIRTQGVGCRSLLVHPGGDAAGGDADGLSRVPLSAIVSGQALLL